MQFSVTFLLILAVFTVFYSGTCVSGAPGSIGDAVDGLFLGVAKTAQSVVHGVENVAGGITKGAEGAVVGISSGLMGRPKEYIPYERYQ